MSMCTPTSSSFSSLASSVHTQKPPYYYISLSLHIENVNASDEIFEHKMKAIIRSALVELFGELDGGNVKIDILHFIAGEHPIAIVRVESSGIVRLWSALTLLGKLGEAQCTFTVKRVSPFLSALAAPYRHTLNY